MGRIVLRAELEERLGRLKPHPSPTPRLEQYTTPANIAAEMLFTAAYVYDDVRDKLVADLGCGTGRLGIGAIMLGSSGLVGVDIDPITISVAVENARDAGVEERCHWIVGEISSIRGTFDTVIMNPPFGTRNRHLDVIFLSEAMRLAGFIYSLHKSSTRRFLTDFIRRRGGEISTLIKMEIDIPRMFSFHERAHRSVAVDLYRIVRPVPEGLLEENAKHACFLMVIGKCLKGRTDTKDGISE